MTASIVGQARKESWQDRLASGDQSLQIHLLGIGGAGLSAIARVLLEMGFSVSGSDRQSGPRTDELKATGARIIIGQHAGNLGEDSGLQPDIVLISSAIDATNPERVKAGELGLPIVKRSEFLPVLLAQKRLIGVAGTHGKSTTTAMIVSILHACGVDAGYIIGAQLSDLGNAAAGSSDIFVIEADEYDHMFLGLRPQAAVITNVEWDHPDCFPTPASFRRAFVQFADGVARDGLIVSCADDTGAEQIRGFGGNRGPSWMTYGLSAGADLRANRVEPARQGKTEADLVWWNAPIGQLMLGVPGVHNVQNAMAALCIANWCDIPMQQAMDALTKFRGTSRRFERKGDAAGVIVIDDYAHHPTEVAATLAAARGQFPDSRIRAVFQPHTFSRTQRMLYRMGDSFGGADQVFVTAIFASREVDEGQVSGNELVTASAHPDIHYVADLRQLAGQLAQSSQPGDVVITLGAGDGYLVGEYLLDDLTGQHVVENGP